MIVALAFAAGVGGRELFDGNNSGSDSISAKQANTVTLGISRDQLNQRLDDAEPISTEPAARGASCLAYSSSDPPGHTWVFCLRDDKLVAKREIASP